MREQVYVVIGENKIVAVYKTQIQAIMRTYRENELLLSKETFLNKKNLDAIWNGIQTPCNSDYEYYWQSFVIE